MFYLGGLTLGYLTPHSSLPDMAAVAPKAAKAKQPSVVLEKTSAKPSGDGDDRPILWPWHIFY